MANALNQQIADDIASLVSQIADDIASLVRKQTFSGSGVWRQSGTATLRIQNQTNSIVEALGRIPSKETQEEEEKEDDRQHAELVGALERDGSGGEPKKKKGLFGSLLSGVGAIGKGLGKSLSGVFKFLKNISSIFKPLAFLLKPIAWLGGAAKGSLKFALDAVKFLFKGLAGFAALVAGAAIYGWMTWDEKDEEKTRKALGLEKDAVLGFGQTISGAIAKSVAKLVDLAITFWDGFAPKEWKVSADTKKKFTDTTFTEVTKAINNVLDFATKIKDEFVAGFDLEGVTKSFTEFKTAIGKAWDSLDGKGAGKTAKTSLLGAANFLGSAVSGIIKTLSDVATGIANLITSPTETIARFQVKIESFFIGIADTLGQILDKFFNMENFLKIAESMGLTIPDQMMLSAAGKRIREKQKEIERLDKLDETLQKQADDAKIKLAEEQKKGGEADKTVLRNLSLSITAAEEQIKRNVDIRTYNKEQITESAKTAAQELKNQKIKKATGLDLQEKEEELQDLKEDSTAISEKVITGGRDELEKLGIGGGEEIKGTVTEFQTLRDLMRRQFDMNIKEGEEQRGDKGQHFSVVKGGVTGEFIKSDEGQRFISELANSGLLSDQGIKFGRGGGDDSPWAAAEKINKFLLMGLRQQRKINALSAQQKNINDEIQDKIKSVEPALERAAIQETALKFGVDKKNIILPSLETVKKQEGGFISKEMAENNLFQLHPNEVVMSPESWAKMDDAAADTMQFLASYLPQSGAVINQLQADRTLGGATGTSEPVVIDNSSQPTIINQTNVAAPQTRGPALVGERKQQFLA